MSLCDTHNILDFILHCSSICGTIFLTQSPCEKLKANMVFHVVQTGMNEFMVQNAKISTKNFGLNSSCNMRWDCFYYKCHILLALG